jgi:hypothetical protein
MSVKKNRIVEPEYYIDSFIRNNIDTERKDFMGIFLCAVKKAYENSVVNQDNKLSDENRILSVTHLENAFKDLKREHEKNINTDFRKALVRLNKEANDFMKEYSKLSVQNEINTELYIKSKSYLDKIFKKNLNENFSYDKDFVIYCIAILNSNLWETESIFY